LLDRRGARDTRERIGKKIERKVVKVESETAMFETGGRKHPLGLLLDEDRFPVSIGIV
jgi:hypothetical protein